MPTLSEDTEFISDHPSLAEDPAQDVSYATLSCILRSYPPIPESSTKTNAHAFGFASPLQGIHDPRSTLLSIIPNPRLRFRAVEMKANNNCAYYRT